MLKKSLVLVAASLPIIGYSEGLNDSADCCPMLPPDPIESCQVPVGYFWPAQYTFDNCNTDISVAGEFLYWELNSDSACAVGTKTEPAADFLENRQTVLVHHQGYKPGFKVSAGIGFAEFDNWNFNLEYTWLHAKSSNFFNTSPNGFILPRDFLVAFDPALLFFSPASSLRSDLRFHLDYLQATIGRPFYLAQRLIIDADVGLKSWWSSLHSDLTYNLTTGLQGTQKTKSSIWGIGPYVLAQIKGLIGFGTYLYGKAGIWAPYSRFTRYHGTTNFPGITTPFGNIPPLSNVEKDPRFHYTTQLFYEGGIGLGWGTYLCGCDYHIDLLIAYDMMTNFITSYTYTLGLTHREFYYQGLTVKAQFDF
ncbi:MAG: hypothetical protein JSS30_02395 [Verrucomicrobia bacterium]|nr:hypothetical protein [Verrucomicrobiota bacterium]